MTVFYEYGKRIVKELKAKIINFLRPKKKKMLHVCSIENKKTLKEIFPSPNSGIYTCIIAL